MRYVTEVTSNLKSGAKAKLGPKTLIVGPNASGKSALINAVELALSGAASDVAGRLTVASDALLRSLVPAGETGRAHVALNDGTTGEWIIGDGRANRSGAEAKFPLRDVYENLLGTPATAQKWILRLSGKSDLPTIVESLARQAREARAKAKTLRDAATAQSTGLPSEPSNAEIEAAKMRGTSKECEAAEAALRLAEERLATTEGLLRAITAKRDTAPAGDATTAQIGGSMVEILTAQLAAGAVSKCGLCGSAATLGALAARRDVIAARTAEARKIVEHRRALDIEVNNAQHTYGVAAADAKSALATVNALKSVAVNGAIPIEIVRLQEKWAAVRKLTAQAEAAEVEAATIVAKANTEKENLDREASKALAAFVATVQSYLPPSDTFGLELDPVRFGLRSGSALRCALSGAEWARVTAAIASAAASPDLGSMSIVVPEERAFDSSTLTAVLRAFSAVPCQVLLASPIEPTEVPSGWTVVRCGVPIEVVVSEETPDVGFMAHTIEAAPSDPIAPATSIAPAEPPKKKRGRPSKAELAAREAAATSGVEPPAEPPAAAATDLFDDATDRGPTNADMIVYARENPKATAADLVRAFPGIAYNRAKAAVVAARGDVEEVQEAAATPSVDPTEYD